MIKALENLFNSPEGLVNALRTADEKIATQIESGTNFNKRGSIDGNLLGLIVVRDYFIRIYGKENAKVRQFSEGIADLARKYSHIKIYGGKKERRVRQISEKIVKLALKYSQHQLVG